MICLKCEKEYPLRVYADLRVVNASFDRLCEDCQEAAIEEARKTPFVVICDVDGCSNECGEDDYRLFAIDGNQGESFNWLCAKHCEVYDDMIEKFMNYEPIQIV